MGIYAIGGSIVVFFGAMVWWELQALRKERHTGPVVPLTLGTLCGAAFGLGMGLLGGKSFAGNLKVIFVLAGVIAFALTAILWWWVIGGYVSSSPDKE
jgi:hypothetical protein